VERALPHYDIKKIVGAADVRLTGPGDRPTKAFLVGAGVSHEELEEIASLKQYEVTVIDAQRV